MELWWVGAAAAAALSLLWSIARSAEKIAKESEATRRVLTAALFPDNQESDLTRARLALETLVNWEAEKRPRLGGGFS